MCVCSCACAHIYVCIRIWRLAVNPDVFHDNSSLFLFLRQGLSLNLNLNDVARLAGYRAPGIHCLHLFSVGITGVYWI